MGDESQDSPATHSRHDESKERGAAHRAGRFDSWANRYVNSLLNWENAKPKRAGRACYRAYTQLFIPLVILVLIAVPLSGRELIWNVDGLSQYYPFFLYEGEWLRGIVTGLLSGNGLNVPLWEWSSGYGADVPTTFDVFLDPLNLVSAITPSFLSEWVFQLLVIVRLYLGGLAFVFYAKTRGENRTGTVLGALLYALCGAGLVVVRWASGLHAFILFPVILAGAERVLAGKKPWVFIASLTLLAITSYYFTYMAAILLVGYLAVRVVMIERPHLTAARFLRWVAVFLGLSLICALLAGFALAPAVLALSGMDRFVDNQSVVPLLYPADYYIRLLASFLSTNDVGSDTYQGFGGLAFFGCLALFMRKGENKALKLVFVVLTVFFLLPCIGSFLNGMNYATNRWAWGYALCVSFILARMTPELLALDARGKRIMAVGALAYAVLFVIPAFRTEANVAGYVALLVALLALLAAQGCETRRNMVGCALAVTLVVNGFYFLDSGEGGKASGQVPLGSAYAKLTRNSVDSIALAANDDTWWRYDAEQVSRNAPAPMNRIANNSLTLGLYGIDFYNSVYDAAVDRFHTELAISDDNINYRYTNLQGRTDLMSLLGVKYYAYRNDGSDAVPYGFDASAEVANTMIMGVDYRLVPARDHLPIGFVFDKAITHDEYLDLVPAQRQQALLQAIVLDEGARSGSDAAAGATAGASTVSAKSLSFEDASVPYQAVASSFVVVEDGRFVALNEGASVTLAFKGVANADTYVYFSGLEFADMKPSEWVTDEARQNMTWYQKANLLLEDFNHKAPTNYEVSVKTDVSPMTGLAINEVPSSHMYGGKDTWLVNAGYAAEPASSVTITFNKPGSYSFNDLQIVTQTHRNLSMWMAERATSTLENAKLGCNRLTGSVDLNAPGTLLITTAKGRGWSAFVDGEPAELLTADTAFMGLDLTAGHHDIELRYFTPGLAEGFMLTGVGIVALVVLILVLRRRGSRGEQANSRIEEKEAQS